jgi:uncharacterized membrane protein
MKTLITADFLRGIIFSYLLYTCYILSGALLLGLYPHFQLVQAALAGVLLAVHLILLIGLLIRPDGSAKVVFIFLALLCLLPIASALYWLIYPLSALPHSPFTRSFLASMFTTIAISIIAYVHLKVRSKHQQA